MTNKRHSTSSLTVRACLLACAAAMLAIAPPAPAQTAATSALAADATQRGVISLLFGGAGGSPVQFYERIGDRLELLGSAQSAANFVTVLKDATTWSCDRRAREQTGPDRQRRGAVSLVGHRCPATG